MAQLLGTEAFAKGAGQPLSLILSLGILLPAIAVAARRLHDIGKSASWLLLALIPLAGSLILIWFYTRPSDGDNIYGPYRPFAL